MISDKLNNIEEGIVSLSNMTNQLGNNLDKMDTQDIMRDGTNIRNNLKKVDFEITQLRGKSKKDNPSVYDIEVDNFNSNKTKTMKNRINELMEATADFDSIRGMQDGGILQDQMVGKPERLDLPPATEEQQTKDLIRQMPEPLLRIIQGQRAGFFPQLGFGYDPYRITIMDALNQEIPTFPEGVDEEDKKESQLVQSPPPAGGIGDLVFDPIKGVEVNPILQNDMMNFNIRGGSGGGAPDQRLGLSLANMDDFLRDIEIIRRLPV